jgi:hypothetical protein
MEERKDGRKGELNTGMMEGWNNGRMEKQQKGK